MAIIAAFFVACPRAVALSFNIVEGPGLASLASTNLAQYQLVRGGIERGLGQWEGLLSTNVTVTLSVDWANIGTPIAQTSTAQSTVTYSAYRSALLRTADPTSAVDALALANLPVSAPSYQMRNAGVSVASSQIRAPQALLKALGFSTSPLIWDGSIILNSRYGYDYERADGIAPNRYDLEGIVAHESAHLLGFSSAVDLVDGMITGSVIPAPMDLFRVSEYGRDLSADNAAKWFSLDGSRTGLEFSTGVKRGDGRQASHWKAGRDLGIMRPETGTGQHLTISQNDLTVLDAMGWNVRASVPEPGSLLLVAVVLIIYFSKKCLRFLS